MFLLLTLSLLVTFWAPSVHSEDAAARQPAVLNQKYEGRYKPQFAANYDRVRLLVKQAQLEVSSRLGLTQYREGFRNPIEIRFEDDAPAGIENALAYVRYGRSSDGEFCQELVVNLQELNAHPMNFDTVFTHEMTHAVLNDAIGGEATMRVPHWLQEGLAEYVSGEGEDRVQTAASGFHKSAVHNLLFNLDGPVYGNGYPYYFLAIKYLEDKHSINALQGIVRELIQGKSLETALQDLTSLTWLQYQINVREYSLRVFKDLAIPDGVTRF